MFDEYFERKNVLDFIDELKHSERYFQKEIGHFEKYPFYVSNELALYIFYDALYLYKIILDDSSLFDEYMEQLEKLYRKLNNFDQIIEGIHQLIGKMVCTKLDIVEIESYESRKKVITYVYKHFITNGYFIHGFNTSYWDTIIENGFVPEQYENYYEDFQKINTIFEKYNISSIIDKDFLRKDVSFTDDFILGCYFSNYAPMYFSSFLENEEHFGKRNRKDGYLIDDYSLSIYGLKRFMTLNLFDMDDQRFILDLVKRQWDLLHRKDKEISLLMVKRDRISHHRFLLDDYLRDEGNLYEVVDRILNSKFLHIPVSEEISTDDIQLINLCSYYEKKEEEITPEEDFYQLREKEVNQDFFNVYGNASIFLLLGSLLITCGVLITIYMILKGM